MSRFLSPSNAVRKARRPQGKKKQPPPPPAMMFKAETHEGKEKNGEGFIGRTLHNYELEVEGVAGSSEEKYLPDMKGTVNFLQRSMLGHLRREKYLCLNKRKAKFSIVKPKVDPLPAYMVDADTEVKKSKGIELGEEEVKSLFSEEGVGGLDPMTPRQVAVDHSFQNASLALCRNKLREDSKALEKDGVMWRYNPKYEFRKRDISKVKNHPMWKKNECVRQILFSVDNIGFEVGDFEPMYCKLCLYDFKKEERITETFSVAFNDPEDLRKVMNQGISSNVDAADPQRRWGIFNLSEEHSEMYLVVKVERVLQGESSQQDGLYLKGNTMRKQTRDLIRRKTMQTIKRLQGLQQPFCWGIMKLFDEDGELIPTGPVEIDQLHFQLDSMSDEQFIRQAKEVLIDSKATKKVQGGVLHMHVVELDQNKVPEKRVDPSGFPLIPPENKDMILPLAPEGIPEPVVQEVQEFHRAEKTAKPHSRFVNNLYLYPMHCNFQKYRNIAVKIEIREQDGSEAEPVKWIFARDNERVSHIHTAVNYHNKKPYFDSEIKIKLPLALNRQAHIFFTFYNVKCKKSSMKKNVKDLIGFCVLPLFSKQALIEDQDYGLRVAEKLPRNYLIPYQHASADNGIRYKFSGEKRFFCRTRVVSNMFTTDPKINAFINTWPTIKELERLAEKKGNYSNILLSQSLEHIKRADRKSLVLFLPGLLDFATEVIATWKHAKKQAFLAMLFVVHRINEYFDISEGQVAKLLLSYVQHIFKNVDPKRPLHITLSECWLDELKDRTESKKGGRRNHEQDSAVLKCSSFIFEIMFKSVVQDFFAEYPGKQKGELHPDFSVNLKMIMDTFVEMLYAHRSLGRFLLQNIVHALARFMVKLFEVVQHDKDQWHEVIALIGQFMDEKDDDGADAVRVDLRADFLHIILVDNDYIVEILRLSALNHILESKETDIDIVSVILEEHALVRFLVEFLQSNFSGEKMMLDKVVRLIQAFFTRIDYDKRYQDKDTKSKIATLFTPLLRVISENSRHLWARALESSNNTAEKRQIRNILAVAVWILKGIPSHIRALWWQNEDPNELADFVALLQLMVSTFEYPSLQRRKAEEKFDCILSANTAAVLGDGNSGTVSDLKNNLESLYNKKSKAGVSLRERRALINKRATTWRRSQIHTLTTTSREYLVSILRLESGMSVVVSRTVLFTLLDVLEFLKSSINPQTGSVNLCSAVNNLIITFLSCHQTPRLWVNLLRTVHLFIETHGKAIFFVSEFSQQIISFVSALLSMCRWESYQICKGCVSALVSLIYANFAATGDLDRVQIALTVSMSTLVPTLTTSEEEVRVQRVVDLLPRYKSESYRDVKTNLVLKPGAEERFSECFDILMKRVTTILKDSIEIRRQLSLQICDRTTIGNLLMRIAEAYVHIPKIHVEHLERLGNFQENQKNFAEAGSCYLEIAQLYEKIQKSPQAANPLKKEKVDIVAKIDYCYLKACEMLDKARLYEKCNFAYKRLIPRYESRRKYNELANAYAHLNKVFSSLALAETKQDRLLGTYYRIGFYGKKFGEYRDGREFVYKKPRITRLVEVVSDMKSLYSHLLNDKVEVHPDSGKIDRSKLDPEKNTIQITYVTPYFDDEDKKNRTDFISKNTNLDKFIFSTPFTLGGKAQGSCTQQCKRKTILRVPSPFPCCKTSQEITSTEELILNPLENAIEDIMIRGDKIAQCLEKKPISYKTLTGLLKGSVATEVNGGPVEICHAFLRDNEEKNLKEYGVARLIELRKVLRKFLQACQRGLDANAERAKPQDILQEHLAKSFDEMCSLMRPYVLDSRKWAAVAVKNGGDRLSTVSMKDAFSISSKGTSDEVKSKAT